jgi:hypothetical protein
MHALLQHNRLPLTKYGYYTMAQKTKEFWRWLLPNQKPKVSNNTDTEAPARVNRTMSTEDAMQLRFRKENDGIPRRRSSQRPTASYPHIQRMVERMGEGRESGLTRMSTVTKDEELGRENENGGGAGRDAVIEIRDS